VDENIVLTQQDEELLTRIDRAVRGESHLEPGLDGHGGFCAVLASAAPRADPAFERQLEGRLVDRLRSQQAAEEETVLQRIGTAGRGWLTLRRGRALAAATVLVIVALALTSAGPRRVWAQIQQWLGYVPGVGFVDLEETRVLTAPVAVSRDGVTLRVLQVLAQPDGTTIILSSEGLPPEDQVWPQGVKMEEEFEMLLRLPDGQVLAPETFTLRWGAGTLEFPPLPADVYRVTLMLPRLPLVPAGVAAEDWAISLDLRPATGELVTALFPQPYSPMDASDTHHGVTLRVLEVAHSPEETALKLRLQWSNPAWETHFIHSFQVPTLRDDLGHVYQEQASASEGGSLSQSVVVMVQPDPGATPTPTPTVPTIERILTFAPVSPSAKRLTLTMSGLEFHVPAEASFTLDLGDNPQVDDTWPLDVDLNVAGFPVHVSRARWEEESMGRPEENRRRTVLQFNFASVEQESIALCGIGLDGEAAGFRGGSTGGYDPQSKRMSAGLVIEEGEQIPTGTIEVRVRGATLCLGDSWTITWEVPGVGKEGEAGTTPVILHPQEATQTRNGLTLRVEEAVLTDRLTGVKVGLAEPPDGITLFRGHRWRGPGAYPRGMTLEDDRGHRYERPPSVTWRSYNEPEPDLTASNFEPLWPLARRLTLDIPAVAVVEPAPAVLDITVPDKVRMTLDAGEVPWPTSEPWEVDIPLEIASYRLHFTEAWFEELNGTTLLTLISEPYDARQNQRRLLGLQIATVTAPDGREVDLETAYSGAGSLREGGTAHRLQLSFDVIDPETLIVQPGRYHVGIDGVTVLVAGPWKLSWDLP